MIQSVEFNCVKIFEIWETRYILIVKTKKSSDKLIHPLGHPEGVLRNSTADWIWEVTQRADFDIFTLFEYSRICRKTTRGRKAVFLLLWQYRCDIILWCWGTFCFWAGGGIAQPSVGKPSFSSYYSMWKENVVLRFQLWYFCIWIYIKYKSGSENRLLLDDTYNILWFLKVFPGLSMSIC